MLISDKIDIKSNVLPEIKRTISQWKKKSIYQDKRIINMPNNRALKYTKQKWTELQWETDKLTIITEDLNTLLSATDGTSN